MGDQFITAADSFGANIVEGYGRYHNLDKWMLIGADGYSMNIKI